jgi:undecaprenyl-diphosphatase
MMNQYINSAISGLVQGLTEFLPVSSSGHLVIFKEILNFKNIDNLFFDVMLHFGTLLAIFVYFKKDIVNISTLFFKNLFKKKSFKEKMKIDEFKTAIYIILGSIPTAFIGFKYKDFFEELFKKPHLVGYSLLFTGFLLLISSISYFTKKEKKELNSIKTLIIGFIQGLAIIPGISRSGSTITSSIMLGISKKKAANFSFLLSIPAVLGATLLQIMKVIKLGTINMSIGAVLLGTCISFISGIIALKIVYKLLENKKFHLFGYYCLVAGFLALKFIK